MIVRDASVVAAVFWVFLGTGCATVSEPGALKPAMGIPQSQVDDAWTATWDVIANSVEAQPPDRPSYGWLPGEIGPDVGLRPPYEGQGVRVGILHLHPISPGERARLRFRGIVPQDRPLLHVKAAGSIHGDFLLECVLSPRVRRRW